VVEDASFHPLLAHNERRCYSRAHLKEAEGRNVDIYTAGYTGQGGGSGGPKTRRSEAAFVHVDNFLELQEALLNIVKGRPLFGQPATTSDELLEEVKRIRAF